MERYSPINAEQLRKANKEITDMRCVHFHADNEVGLDVGLGVRYQVLTKFGE